ncbi:hypothetical protein MTO96_031266 [Rhipicephalus appendiculatus]
MQSPTSAGCNAARRSILRSLFNPLDAPEAATEKKVSEWGCDGHSRKSWGDDDTSAAGFLLYARACTLHSAQLPGKAAFIAYRDHGSAGVSMRDATRCGSPIWERNDTETSL